MGNVKVEGFSTLTAPQLLFFRLEILTSHINTLPFATLILFSRILRVLINIGEIMEEDVHIPLDTIGTASIRVTSVQR